MPYKAGIAPTISLASTGQPISHATVSEIQLDRLSWYGVTSGSATVVVDCSTLARMMDMSAVFGDRVEIGVVGTILHGTIQGIDYDLSIPGSITATLHVVIQGVARPVVPVSPLRSRAPQAEGAIADPQDYEGWPYEQK
jgi:hypothetical protein